MPIKHNSVILFAQTLVCSLCTYYLFGLAPIIHFLPPGVACTTGISAKRYRRVKLPIIVIHSKNSDMGPIIV